MIRTLTLNPAVDRTVTIERFRVDAVNRITDSRLDPGGKGINVSKAVHGLGGQSIAYGFLGGAAGGFIRSYLEGRGIPQRFIELEGETRTNLKVVDPLQSTHTDINESGPLAAAGAVARLEAQLFSDTGPGDVLVF